MQSMAMQTKKNEQAAVLSTAAPLLYWRRPSWMGRDEHDACGGEPLAGDERPFVAPRALISTRFEAGGISGPCARRSAGPDRRAGVYAKVLLVPANLRDVRMSKGAASGIT